MCKKSLLVCFVLLCSVVSLAAEQQYRISESQLQSIETLLEKLERDRQSWALQAQGLRLEAESLNVLLAREREQYRILEQSFNRYETSQSEKAAKLMLELETARLEKERYKRAAGIRLAVIISLAGVLFLVSGIMVYRFFRKPKR
jgi:hypothetical protein